MRFVASLPVIASIGLAACARSAPLVATAQAAPATKSAPELPRAPPPSDSGDEETEASSGHPDAPAWLGVELALRLPEEPGVLVRSVVPGSPAARAGVLAGDVILSVEGQTVGRPSELVAEIAGRRVGERVGLALLRHGDSRLLSAELEALPNEETLMKKRYIDEVAPALGALLAVQGNVEANWQALRGRVVVVEFWATWCAPCRLTAPLLSSWSDRHTAEGLRVLGITTDPVPLAAEGARKASMSYSVFSDDSGDTVRAYRAFALPTLFVVDRRGVVRDVVVGYSSERLRQVDALLQRLLAER